MTTSPQSGTSSISTAGNIVTIGIRLYRQNAKSYLKLSFLALGGVLLPVVIAGLVLVAAVQLNSPGLGILAVVAGLGITVFTVARYLAASAAITRHGIRQIMNNPESFSSAQRFTAQRKWGFLWITFMMSLLFSAVTTGLYMVAAIAIMVVVFAVGGTSVFSTASPDPATAALIGIFSLLAFVIVLIAAAYVFLWLTSRFILSEVGYAAEDDRTQALSSLTRSWQLTTGNWRRIVQVLSMIFLVSFPIQVATQLVATTLLVLMASVMPTYSFFYGPVSGIVFYGVGMILGAVLLPLWQVTKSVVYCDLLIQREGVNLQLGDRPPWALSNWLNHARIVTPESVELEFTLAGIGSRSLALLLDYVFLGVGLLAFWVLCSWFADGLISWLETLGFNYITAPIWLFAIALLISFILFVGYFFLFETLWRGQTPGKRIFHLRVIQSTGQPIGATQALLRSLLRPIDDTLLLGALFIIFGKQEQRIGDLVANTLVIQESYADKKRAIVISSAAKTLAALLPDIAQVKRLSSDNFATLTEYLQQRSRLDPTIQKQLRTTLAHQARELVHLQEVPPGVTADQFLEALYVAYQRQ